MSIWTCNRCGAKIKQDRKPGECAICKQSDKGFEENPEPVQDAEDKKSSELYKKALAQLEEYTEGLQPEDPRFCDED